MSQPVSFDTLTEDGYYVEKRLPPEATNVEYLGTTGVACKLEGRKAVLVEISEEYCETIADRLRQGVLF